MGELQDAKNWRDRLCQVEDGQFRYESAKKKGEAELVAKLADIAQVRPLPSAWMPGYWIFRVDLLNRTRCSDDANSTKSTVQPTIDDGTSGPFFFSASSAEERSSWIAVLTKHLRRASSRFEAVA